MKIRLYGKTLQEWTTQDENGREWIIQSEISYRDIDIETGDVVATGSEDFSPERKRRELTRKWLYTWDGERRNKGGKRWFECRGLITFRSSEKGAVKEYYQRKYKASCIQFR